MLINVHNWRGENYYIKDESLLAEQEYNAAINLIETTESKLSVPANGDFGKVYNNRGDLRYHFYDDLNLALKDYQQAEDFLYKSPALDYKIGRIQYIYEGYKESLLRFYQASKAFPHEPTILLAMANTYFNRDDYAAAQGEYLLLLDILEDELTHIPLLRPAENPTHKNLLTKLMVTHNNLGVTLKRQAEAPRNPRKETEALLHFTKASEYSDLLSRNPDTVKRGEALSFGYINTRALLYPISGNSLVLYHMLPKELKDGNWPTKPKTTE
jgi:tetratricopeptide (TPR) repeat protein